MREEEMSVMKCRKLKNRWKSYNWLRRSQKTESWLHSGESQWAKWFRPWDLKGVLELLMLQSTGSRDKSGLKTRVLVESLLRKPGTQFSPLLVTAPLQCWQICPLKKVSKLLLFKSAFSIEWPMVKAGEWSGNLYMLILQACLLGLSPQARIEETPSGEWLAHYMKMPTILNGLI